MNLYCNLATLKARLGISGTGSDAVQLVLLEGVSRSIDQWCNRRFFVKMETRSYDGSRSPLLLDEDLAALTTLKTDDDGDGVAESTWAASDYALLPYQGSPKYAIEVTPWGTRGDFNPGQRKAVEVAGRWGYDETTQASSATVSGNHSASATTLAVSDGTQFSPGDTLLVESEQLSVSAVSGNNLTVRRGVNGTTAASHSGGTAIAVVTYPAAVREACLLQAARRWMRRDPAFATVDGLPGAVDSQAVGMDADARALLAQIRKYQVTGV